MLAALDRVEPGRRLALEADEAVRVVLEDVQAVVRGELRDALPPRLAERSPARVLERRDRVEERDVAPARELGLEHVGVEPLLVHRERDDLGPVPAEDLQRPVVGRPFDEHAARAALELDGGVEDEALEPAGRDEDPARVDAVTRREELAQRAVAAARPVREDRLAVSLEHGGRAVRHEPDVDALRGRGAAREGDGGHADEPTRRPRPERLLPFFLRSTSVDP